MHTKFFLFNFRSIHSFLLQMKKTVLISIFLIIFFAGCGNKINQFKNHKKEGKWVTNDTLEYIYKTVGKYHNGLELGTWKYYYNTRLVRKDKYKLNIIKTKYYYTNGNIQKKGYSMSENDENETHWFYFGKWYEYDKNSNLVCIYNYNKGVMIDSILMTKN